MFRMEHRYDILAAANSARFYLRHYARGIYPPASLHPLRLPVNRMFFPLRNPNGKCNYIRDCRGTSILEPGRFYFIPAFYAAEVHLDEDLYFLSIQSSLEICPGTELFSDCSSMQVLPAPAELPLLLKLFESPPGKTAVFLAGIESGGLCSSDQGACALSGGGFSESAFAAALFRVDGLSFAARECLNPGFATGGLPGGVPGRIHPAFFFRNRNLSEAADRPFFDEQGS